MVERVSALSGHYSKGPLGGQGECGVTLSQVANLSLMQIAAWPDTLDEVGARAAQLIEADTAPGPGRVVSTPKGALLRVEPLKWWLVGGGNIELPSALEPMQGSILELSHSRTHLGISGPQAGLLLNRYLPLDLRDAQFPVGTVASTAFHHTGVTLWRSERGFEIFIVRGFALSLWQLLLEGGAQFNAKVV